MIHNVDDDIHAAPSAPPSSVTVINVTYSTITVWWGEVDCIHQNGDITGYLVQYRVMGTSGDQQISIGGSNTQTTISNLMLSTTYSIQVTAINSAGIGVLTDPVVQRTLS